MNYPNNPNHRNNPNNPNSRGSILIWTVLLGVVLTSVFFFFAMRLGMNAAAQRDTIMFQNAKAFVESYADYLQNNPSEMTINFEGITGNLVKQGFELEGFLDSGKSATYAVFTGPLKAEWNKCPENLGGDLLFTDGAESSAFAHSTTPCVNGTAYNDSADISVSGAGFTLTAISAPFHYRLTGQNTAITDNKWRLSLTYPLEYGKNVEIKRTF